MIAETGIGVNPAELKAIFEPVTENDPQFGEALNRYQDLYVQLMYAREVEAKALKSADFPVRENKGHIANLETQITQLRAMVEDREVETISARWFRIRLGLSDPKQPLPWCMGCARIFALKNPSIAAVMEEKNYWEIHQMILEKEAEQARIQASNEYQERLMELDPHISTARDVLIRLCNDLAVTHFDRVADHYVGLLPNQAPFVAGMYADRFQGNLAPDKLVECLEFYRSQLSGGYRGFEQTFSSFLQPLLSATIDREEYGKLEEPVRVAFRGYLAYQMQSRWFRGISGVRNPNIEQVIYSFVEIANKHTRRQRPH